MFSPEENSALYQKEDYVKLGNLNKFSKLTPLNKTQYIKKFVVVQIAYPTYFVWSDYTPWEKKQCFLLKRIIFSPEENNTFSWR